MDAAPWEKDPVTAAAPAASAAPWENDPPTEPHGLVPQQAAPAPVPAQPEVIPDTDPRAGLAIPGTISQTAAAQQSAPPAPPVDPNRQLSLDLTAADKGLVADTLGAPVDLATAGINSISYIANMIAKLFGSKNDVTPYVENPAGGSQSISALGGQVNKLLTGHDVPTPETPLEKIRSNAVELGSGAAATEALGPLLKAILSVARPAEIAKPTVTASPLFRAAEDTTPTGTSIAKAGAAGVGAGAVEGVEQQFTPDSVKKTPVLGPTLDLLAAALGGVGGHGLANAAEAGGKFATAPVRRAFDVAAGKDNAFTTQDGTKATAKDLNAAAQVAQNTAIDPGKAKQAVADTTNQLRAEGPVTPTTGAMSGDPGLVGLEQKLRQDPNYRPAFIKRDQEVQQAALTSAEKVAPDTALGRTFTDTATRMQADRENAARTAVADTERNLDVLGQRQTQTAGTVAAARGGEAAASADLDRSVVDHTLRPMQERSSQMYREADPNREAPVDTNPLIAQAQAVRDTLGDFNTANKIIPQGLLNRIEATAGEVTPATTVDTGIVDSRGRPITRTTPEQVEPSQTSVGDIVAVYPELATTETRARKAGNYNLADNIRALRGSFDEALQTAADNGDEAAQRALDAQTNYRDTVGTVFGSGPGDEATKFRKDFNLDRNGRSTTPPSQTADRFLKPGEPEKADSLNRILDHSATQAEGRRAVGQYLAADLASSGAIDTQGRVNPRAVEAFRTKWGDTLGLAPAFRRQVDALATGATADSQQALQLTAQLRDQQAVLRDVEQNNTAFNKVVGKSPSNSVAAIFSSGDPEAAVAEIMGRIGQNTAAHDGFKAAIRDYLVEKGTTSALSKTTTGDNPLSFAKLDTLFKQNQSALSRVLSPKEMASLQASHRFLASLENLKQQSLAGSATAERAGLADKMWRVVEIGLKTLHGGLRGGNEVRNLKLAAALQGGGPDQVAKLLVEMQFNPELAMHLFGRNVPKQGNTKFDQKLFNRLVLSSAVARDSNEPVKITVNGGATGNSSKTSVEQN